MVKYCVANECPIDECACANAAEDGHLECLKYLHEEAKAPWDWRTAAWAAANGHLHILEYLVERKYDKYDAYACEFAAENGHLDCLKYLHETAKAPWNYWAVQVAHENKHPTVYNTSSTTTVHYQTVGDTKEEHYTTRNNRRGVQDRAREREKRKARLSEYAEQRDKYIDMVLETAQN